jgi:beta-galactosidase
MRAWLWSSWGHGADAHFIFRWRTCLSGQEQELQGILEHSGEPRHRYRAVQRMFTEMADLRGELADAPVPVAKIAIVQDYNVIWAYESARVGESVHYPQTIYRLHKELYRRNLLADFIPPEREFSAYQLVILPSLVILHPALIDSLKRYVEGGGIVLALGQIGMRDVNNNYFSEPAPYGLQDLLGVKIFGGMYLRSFVEPDEALWWPAPNSSASIIPVDGILKGEPVHGEVKTWAADMELCGATPLMTFTADTYQGQPAIVEKVTGGGKSIYVGSTHLDDALYNHVLEFALESAGIAYSLENPLHIEILQRGAWTVFVNHTRVAVDIPWESGGRAFIGSCANRQISLPPFGVCLIKRGAIRE